MLTPGELDALPAKAKRDQAVVELYRSHDYLTAYGLHTDRRVQQEGYAAAAGSDASRDNWNRHGELQRDCLVMQGLRPWHRLLDFGCGAGRLARHVTRYLEVGHYYGVDLSAAALSAAGALAVSEGWVGREPHFWLKPPGDVAFDVVWAHSVFTHLPPELAVEAMRQIRDVMRPTGVFYWTFIPSAETVRYGLTQFKATLEVQRECAAAAGLTFDEVPDWVQKAGHVPGRWSYGQSLAVSRAC